MKFSTTLVLVVLLAAVIGAIYKLGPVETEEPGVRHLFPAFARGKVRALELKLFSGETVKIRRRGASAYDLEIVGVHETIQDRANRTRVQHLLELLETAVIEVVNEEVDEDALKEFGLRPARTSILVEDDRGQHRILFGDDEIGGGTCYAQIEGEKAVLRTARNFKNALEFNARDFRFDRIFTFSNLAIDSLEITRPPDQQHPEGEQLLIDKTSIGWRIKEPFEARAADSKVMSAINSLSQAKISRYIESDPDPDQMTTYGLVDPITVTLGSGEAVETVAFGWSDEEAGFIFAQRVGSMQVVQIRVAEVPALLGRPQDYISKRLIRAITDTATDLIAEYGGERRYRIQRAGKRMMLTEPFRADAQFDGDSECVDWVLRQVERTEAEEVLTAEAALKRLPSKTPIGTLSVRWLERKIPLTVLLSFYRGRGGELFVQRDDDLGFFHQVPESLIDVLTLHPFQLRDRVIFPVDRDWVKDLQSATAAVDGELLEIVRPSGEFWEAKGDPRRRTAKFQSWIANVMNRRAVRFIPPPSETLPEPSEPGDYGSVRSRIDMIDKDGELYVFELLGATEDGAYLRTSVLPEGCLAIVDREMEKDMLEATSTR